MTSRKYTKSESLAFSLYLTMPTLIKRRSFTFSTTDLKRNRSSEHFVASDRVWLAPSRFLIQDHPLRFIQMSISFIENRT